MYSCSYRVAQWVTIKVPAILDISSQGIVATCLSYHEIFNEDIIDEDFLLSPLVKKLEIRIWWDNVQECNGTFWPTVSRWWFFVPPSRLIVTLLNCFVIYVRLFVIVWLLKSSFDDVSWNGTERWCFVLALHYSSGLHVRLLTDWLIRRSHVTGVVACSFCTAVGYDCYCCWTCSFMRRDFHHLVEGPGLLAVICALRRWSRCIYCDNSTADFFHTLHRHR